jgi:hypothetical protein
MDDQAHDLRRLVEDYGRAPAPGAGGPGLAVRRRLARACRRFLGLDVRGLVQDDGEVPAVDGGGAASVLSARDRDASRQARTLLEWLGRETGHRR